MDKFSKRDAPSSGQTLKSLLTRLYRAGFKKEFARAAILPEWWDDDCTNDLAIIPDIEIRVARFLGLPLVAVKDARTKLVSPTYPNAQLRRVRDIDRDRLSAAIHAALKISSAVVRSLREPSRGLNTPPDDGLAWHREMKSTLSVVTLDTILDDLWNRGIPVVPIDILPAPSFQGLACVVDGRPVILLGHKHDEPARTAFFLAHESAHIVAGDCAKNQPVLDEDEEIVDQDAMEKSADQYANNVLYGGQQFHLTEDPNFKDLATQAHQMEMSTGVDAGFVIFNWAHRTQKYDIASLAANALYKGSGARKKLRQHFDLNVDLDAATECDRSLLRCVYGDPDRHATSG